jgi:apolipoprotein D and lipocalin family protein
MTMRAASVAIALTLAGLGLSGCVGQGAGDGPPIPLANVDMDRMYGGWYLIATVRNGFEKGMVAPYDVYSKRPDGDIREDFYVRRGGFDAPRRHFVVHDWVRPGAHNAHWRVQVFWPVNLPFLVLYVDPRYRYVMFGENNRKLGWIYARAPKVPDADYQDLIARFAALGYDTRKFVKFVQTPDEIGQPGVWDEGIK